MSERYVTLFRCNAPQSQKDAPVLLSAGALLGDKQTGSVLVQLKLQNISKKSISVVYASVLCVDAMNAPIKPAVDVQYLELNIQPGVFLAIVKQLLCQRQPHAVLCCVC